MRKIALITVFTGFFSCNSTTMNQRNLGAGSCVNPAADKSTALALTPKETVRKEISLSEDDGKVVCDIDLSLSCNLRVFKPGISDGESLQEECFDSEDGKSHCYQIKSWSYNTGTVVTNADGYQEGGDYNRKEYSCYNLRLKVGNINPVQGEGESLAIAVKNAQAFCLSLVKKAR